MWLRVKSSKYTTFTLAHSAPGLLIVPGNGPAPGRGVGFFLSAIDGGAYCRDRWGISKSRANQLVGAAKVVGNLATTVAKPTNEAQARPLTRLPVGDQQAPGIPAH